MLRDTLERILCACACERKRDREMEFICQSLFCELFMVLLMFRYTKRVRPSRYGYSSKSITRTLSCTALQNHLCWQSIPSYTGQPNWNADVPTDIGKSHHYKKCHFDKYLHKNGVCHRMMTRVDVTRDRTMFRFRDKLANTVAKKLLELDLVELADDDGWKKFYRMST